MAAYDVVIIPDCTHLVRMTWDLLPEHGMLSNVFGLMWLNIKMHYH
jgi:hypothetical protein